MKRTVGAIVLCAVLVFGGCETAMRALYGGVSRAQDFHTVAVLIDVGDTRAEVDDLMSPYEYDVTYSKSGGHDFAHVTYWVCTDTISMKYSCENRSAVYVIFMDGVVESVVY